MIRLSFGVTNNSKNFTRTAGGEYKIGDLLILSDATKGSIVMEIATVVAGVGGTFTQNYIGSTATVNGDILPVSSIDPSTDTVLKTQLVQQIVDAMAADQRNAANWGQVLSDSPTDVTVTLPDGSTLSGPAWGNIVEALAEKLDKDKVVGTTVNGAIIESGSNANGYYLKLIDGTLICTHTINVNCATAVQNLWGSTSGTGYRGPDSFWAFPVSFKTGTKPVCTANPEGRYDHGGAAVHVSNVININGVVRAWCAQQSTIAVQLIAIGVWK